MIRRHSLILIILLFFPTTVYAAVRYVVKKGDTLYGLSKKFGVSLDEIKEANRIQGENLKIGSVIFVPETVAANSLSAPKKSEADKLQYVVIKGDTLYGIASGFRVSAGDIRELNNIKGDGLRIGQKLLIPIAKTDASGIVSRIIHESKTQGAGIAPPPSAPPYDSGADNDGISRDIPNPIGRLGSDNSFSSVAAADKPIPPAPPDADSPKPDSKPIHITRRYIAKTGDSLDKIAKEFEVSPEVITEANGLDGNKLDAGSVLLIPNADALAPVPVSVPAPSGDGFYNQTEYKKKTIVVKRKPITGANAASYVVRKGDTAFSIAKKFNIPLAELREMNNIPEDGIMAGQTLIVPASASVKSPPPGNGPQTIAEKRAAKKKQPQLDGLLTRDNIISIAKRYLGVPYRFGGTSLITGLDCSAFISRVFGFFDIKLPRTAREQFAFAEDVKRDDMVVGDLVFFKTYARYPSHVGIYMGENEFIHASSGAKMVTITNLDDPYYRKRYLGAKRVEVGGLFYGDMARDYKGFDSK
ncbi:MAG: LysM peptidoglycan-binding domain-containing protein [Deltaproteobacteria bacterium]